MEFLDFAAPIEQRSFDDERIDDDMKARYGLEARTMQEQLLMNALIQRDALFQESKEKTCHQPRTYLAVLTPIAVLPVSLSSSCERN